MEKFYVVVKNDSLWDCQLLKDLKKQALTTDNINEAKAILVFGGDGTMLRAIRKFWKRGLPFAGLNFGHVGFLTNESTEQVLSEIISGQQKTVSVRLLQADLYGKEWEKLGQEIAFNEFYVEKTELLQTAKIRVTVDLRVRFDPLICNGILVSTSAGSTAYNASASGEILPIEAEEMVLTGIAPARLHRWRSSILPKDTQVLLEAVDAEERPVTFVSDNKILLGVAKARIYYSNFSVKLSFAVSQDFREKILNLNF